MIKTICDKCGNEKLIDNKFNGKKFKCPICTNIVNVIGFNEENSFKNITGNGINFIFPELKEAISHNLSLRKKYNCQTYVTKVFPSKQEWLDLKALDPLIQIHNLDSEGKILNESLCIEIDDHFITEQIKNKIKNIEEYKLIKNPESKALIFVMNDNVLQTANLVTKLLILLFDLNESSTPFFTTHVENLFDSDDHEDDSRWWVEDATDEQKDRHNREAILVGFYTRNPDGSYNNTNLANTTIANSQAEKDRKKYLTYSIIIGFLGLIWFNNDSTLLGIIGILASVYFLKKRSDLSDN